jgi:hypothetical protein
VTLELLNRTRYHH